jgi:hypothetical protein
LTTAVARSTDKIGRLYNMLRKELEDFFSDVRPLADFRGLIINGHFDRDMYVAAEQIARISGVNIALIVKKREKSQRVLADAEAAVNACPLDDRVARRKAFKERNKAKAALYWYEERSRQEMRNMIHLVRKWANGNRPTHATGSPLSTQSRAKGARAREASSSLHFRRNSST